jgi:hypothetical protein
VSEANAGLKQDDFPALYRALSAQAAGAQKNVLLAVKVGLGGALVAAALGLIEIEADGVDLAALAAAIGFAFSLAATGWLLWQRPERDWYDARAGAESVKTLTWQFAVGGGEFPLARQEDDVRTRFLARLRELLTDLGTVRTAVAAGEEQIPAGLLVLRSASIATRQAAYKAGRIEDQQAWYAEKAAWNTRRRLRWAIGTVLIQILGLLAGLGRAFLGLDIDFLGLAAALVAAITAWTRTKDYAELSEAYAVTAQEIGLLAAEHLDSEDEVKWSEFVETAERAFSREHTLWRARKGHRPVG